MLSALTYVDNLHMNFRLEYIDFSLVSLSRMSLVLHIIESSEDFYTQVALWLPRILLKCIFEPSNGIKFIEARTRSSIFV